MSGIAICLHCDEDPEIDADEEGTAYASREYFFGGTCNITIRIDMDTHGKVIVNERPGAPHDYICPFESVGIMRKIR